LIIYSNILCIVVEHHQQGNLKPAEDLTGDGC